MFVECPNCHTRYEVPENLLLGGPKKMHCSSCEAHFVFDASAQSDSFSDENEEQVIMGKVVEEAEQTENNENEKISDSPEEENQQPAEENAEEKKDETPKEDELSSILKRLSKQSDELKQTERKMSAGQKFGIALKREMLSKNARKVIYSLLAFVLLLSVYYFRFEIVRTLPFMEKVYSALNIKSVVVGEGLEFRNIERLNYEEDYVQKMEIKGFIFNTTDQAIALPIIHLEVMDKDTAVLQTQDEKIENVKVLPNSRIPFRIIVEKPSPLSKYVYLTFREKEE